MEHIKDIIGTKVFVGDKRNKYEYQAYGNRLAEELNDTKKRSLYIKLAKNVQRNLLEQARECALSAEKITAKGKIFMWKLTQLRKGVEEKI